MNIRLVRLLLAVAFLFSFFQPGLSQLPLNQVKMVVNEQVPKFDFTSYQAMGSVTLLPGFEFTPGVYTVNSNSYRINDFSIVMDGTVNPADNTSLVTENTVRTDVIKVKGITNEAQIWDLPIGSRQTQISYMDGLGRPLQRINPQGSPLKKDLVEFMSYNNLGRQTKAFLPYVATTTDGSFQANAEAAQKAFYLATGDKIANDAFPYSENRYDESPFERVLESGSVGQDWQLGAHTVRNQFRLNAASENIKIWTAAGPTTGTYGEGQLSISEGTDQNGNKVISYNNKLGQTVLKRVQADVTTYLETVYIYNDLGNLIYQVSPEAVRQILGGAATWTAAFINTWVFTYTYDSRNRLVEKKVPGAEPVYLIYDALDRVVLVQEGRLRNMNRWYFTKYDQVGRSVMSGIYHYVEPTPSSGTTFREKLQNYMDGLTYNNTSTFAYEIRKASTSFGYSNQSFPTAIVDTDVLSVNYYDDYDFDNNGTADYVYKNPNTTGTTTAANTLPAEAASYAYTRGQTTGSRSRVVGTTQWIIHTVFYDRFGNAIQDQSNNYLNPLMQDYKSNVYDVYAGRLTHTKVVKQTSTTAVVTVVNKLSYNHLNQPTQVVQNTNASADQVVAQYEYNELGQLVDKKLHKKADGTFLQSVDFRYHIRGWLASINNSTLSADNGETNDEANDVFGMNFLYNEADGSGLANTPYYNGKLSAIKWKTWDQFSVADAVKYPQRQSSYRFTYDKVDRLTAATYAANGGTTWDKEVGAYDELVSSYDANGNIQRMQRYTKADANVARTLIDDLTYNYSATGSNQLRTVSDASTYVGEGFKNGTNTGDDFTYDGNGNLLTDANKGLTLTYNDLDKTSRVDFGGGKYTDYVYSASGERIRKIVYTSNQVTATYDYIEGYIYLNANLSYLPTSEGKVRMAGSTTVFEYFIKDHLGNVRVSFEDNGNGVAKVSQENHYYAFGMTMRGVVNRTPVPTNANKQLFNGGSELQDDYGFENSYSTFYREYDPVLGRFNAIDVKADKYSSWTPYNFAFNDPIGMNDPLGDDAALDAIIQTLLHTPNGGKWTQAGGVVEYTSQEEAFQAGVDYNNRHGSWGNTAAGSYENAYTIYNMIMTNPAIAAVYKNASTYGAVSISNGRLNLTTVSIGDQGGHLTDYSFEIISRIISPLGMFDKGSQVMAPREGFWDYLDQFLNGDRVVGRTAIAYDGTSTGRGLPMGGEGPSPSMGAGGAVKAARGLWKLTKEGASAIKSHKTWGTFYKSMSDGLWWSTDKLGHGGSKFKVFKETNKGLEWYKDADEYGNFILNKHKGETGMFLDWFKFTTVF